MPKLNEQKQPLNEKEAAEKIEEFQHLREATAQNAEWHACYREVVRLLASHGLSVFLQTLIHALKHDPDETLRNREAAVQMQEVTEECYSIP